MNLQEMIDIARASSSPEEQAIIDDKYQARLAEFNRKTEQEWRCHTCGVDTLMYSHTFDCKWRGH